MKLKKATFIVALITICATSCVNKDNAQIRIEDSSSSQSTNEFKVYSNIHFSVEYPTDWQVVEKPDGFSDVYIGYTDTRRIGFTVLHFPCEPSLKEANEEGNANYSNAGAKIVSCTQTTVSGVPAYKNVSTRSLSGMSVKDVSYVLKVNGELYNIRFGTDPDLVDSNADVIEKIVASFRVK